MDVKPVFKQTEVGVIPGDWEVRPLGRLVRSVEYGSSAKSDVSGAVPVLRMGNLQGGKIDWSDLVFTSDAAEISKYNLRPGDVLFNRTNTTDLVGKTSIYEGERPAIFAGYLIRINVDPDLLNPWFLNYILNTELSRKYSARVLSVAVGQANINGQKLRTYPIPVPPTKAEQEAIAVALRDVDALAESLERLVAKKRLLKQGAMHELLTGRRRLPGFPTGRGRKDLTSPNDAITLPDIPEDWHISPLQDVGRWFSGGTPSMKNPAYWEGEFPWVSPKDMKSSRIFDTGDHITNKAIADGARLLPPGSVLLVIRGMILAHSLPVARAERPVAFNQDMKALVVRGDIDSDFVLYWLLCHAQKLLGLTTESTHGTKRLPPESLYRVPFPVPPTKAEQSAIASILIDMDADIEALEAKLAKARLIKQGLMQELLTGRIRLV